VNWFFQGATLLFCHHGDDKGGDGARTVQGDVHVKSGRIEAILPPGSAPPQTAKVVDVRGKWILPGLVQTHVHTVQTLFRGLADDLALLDWLRLRIWPLEAAHDHDSVYWSARLGITELLTGGTTAILDMATVHHTDAVFAAAEEAGIRAYVGKAMMDRDNSVGLSEPTEQSLQSACDLRDRWHGRGRLRYAFAPRFIPSCTDDLLRQTVAAARETGCLIHTHASENQDEIELVRSLTGRENIDHIDHLGATGRDVVLAHCIHLADHEMDTLARTDTTVAHCPGSNLKLASGIAPIPALLDRGVRCTLGADGAPCNNRLDAFAEMRLAALIQKPRLGPEKMPASTVFDMATRKGAEALGLSSGTLSVGEEADLVVVDPAVVSGWGAGDPISAVVYALTPAAVRQVWIAGECVARDGQVIGWDTEETLREATQAVRRVMERAKFAPPAWLPG